MLHSQYKTAGQSGPDKLKTRYTSILFMVMMMYLVLPFYASGSNHPEEQTFTCQQQDTTSGPNMRRLWITGSAHVLLYTITLAGLDGMWYRDYPRSSFHFFDDLPEWKQMDKAAHAANAYQLSRLSYYTFRHAGLGNNKAAIWGSVSGAVFLTTVEIMDGFSCRMGCIMVGSNCQYHRIIEFLCTTDGMAGAKNSLEIFLLSERAGKIQARFTGLQPY
jgi:hypothetical protein